MALVCDIKSEDAKTENEAAANEDLEDGEIEDDDEEMPVETVENIVPENEIPPPPPQINVSNKFVAAPFAGTDFKQEKFGPEKTPLPKFESPQQRRSSKHEDKKKSHMTEAEKSVMYLHKLERMEREKREKYRREPVDDFASNIEKAIANVLKKDRTFSDEEKEEEKRGKKRKKKDKERRKKQRKMDSPNKNEEFDDIEILNFRGGSPDLKALKDSDDSITEESDGSSDRSGGGDRKERRREKREKRNRNRERRGDNGKEKKPVETLMKDSPHLCVYYIQGKCQKGDECTYSHELQPPMKWELCKFYLNDCCAKGDKCLYMHSDFPCKFYHTGQPCLEGENCKFAHGRPLSDRLKQILFKHIETAPKDILGRFPRMGREEAVYKINQTQKTLEVKYGVEKKEGNENINKSNIPSLFDISVPVPVELMQDEKSDKPTRNRPSRWQDADPKEKAQALQEQRKMQLQMDGFGLKNIGRSGQDQDMRISSNGDIDMRTLAPLSLQQSQKSSQQGSPGNSNFGLLGKQKIYDSRPVDIEQYKREAGFISKMDTDIRSLRGDMDIRTQSNAEATAKKDVDARQMNFFDEKQDVDIRRYSTTDNEDEPQLEIVVEDDQDKSVSDNFDTRALSEVDVPLNLPKRQRELFMRIQAQQKENLPDQLEQEHQDVSDMEENIDWYSDDSNEGRLTIKDDDDVKEKEEEKQMSSSNSSVVIKPMEVVEKLGDLSKIDISEEVTKLLSSMRQSSFPSAEQSKPRDPRQNRTSPDRVKAAPVDPRKARASVDEKPTREQKISIYEQGSFDPETLGKDVDLRSIDKDLDLRPKFDLCSTSSGRPDIDLRQLSLPFKGIQNYTPATEIDASINSHLPIVWIVQIVEIPKPDYTGLKLSLQEAQTTGDPRLRKIFRLSIDEKDSPASPKESPKATPNPRVDPRRRKIEEAKSESGPAMSYAQQMTVLQGSAFYQNLTSNQKVMLNQELSTRDQSGSPNEQVLAGMLGMLGLVPGQSGPPNINGSALNLLSTLMMNQNVLGQNPNTNMLGPNPNLLNQNANILGGQNPNMQVNPNIIGQNSNLMNQIVQPGLLGAAPGIPNMPPDFQINFDPRNGGLLGNAPLPFVNSNFNFNEDYYPEGGGGGNNFNSGNREGRGGGFNRDRPHRRGRNFNRNNRNNNFRNRNRSNRSHTPP